MKQLLLSLFIVVCLMGDTNVRVIGGTTTVSTPSTLGNISTRAFVQMGANILDGGFIIQGTQPKTVIIRAIGPDLGLPHSTFPMHCLIRRWNCTTAQGL